MLPYFAGATVYVVPLLVGGGTRLKVLEAMAMSLPIVSTTLGSDGLEIGHGRELVLADDPMEFVSAVIDLLEDESARQGLGERARQFVEQYYDWRSIVPRLERVYAPLA
jgi:glycosyltransferase involved in cell wall biosynthesis